MDESELVECVEAELKYSSTPLTREELIERLNVNRVRVSDACRTLRYNGTVKFSGGKFEYHR